MSRKISFQTKFFAILLFLFFSGLMSHADESVIPGPKIAADSYMYNFGKVDEGVELKHVFKITNTGSKTLQIFHVQSTCGCTIPKLAKQQLQPDESTDLEVIVDTAMKQDKITKIVSLTCNDPSNNTPKFYLSMFVLNPHVGLSDQERAKIFTSDKCSSCHVSMGVGTYGKELYEADCAMCHGKRAQGVVGPCLKGPYESPAFKDSIAQITSYGSPTHRSMPGFLASAGGPLSKEQIDSIVKYLADLSKQSNQH